MVEEARRDVLRLGFGGQLLEDKGGRPWNHAQLWKTITQIAQHPQAALPYHDVLFGIFKGNVDALHALVRQHILTIEEVTPNDSSSWSSSSLSSSSSENRALYVRPFSPLYLQVFKRLLSDSELRRGLDKLCYEKKLKEYETEIQQIEQELVQLHNSAAFGAGVEVRRKQLDHRLRDLCQKASEQRTKIDLLE
eukprot:TRINITY_DN7903_c0_g1_i1.p1 TRINITY_DN7903_c0_g1~~TRINITY_DN7903_c0_g1_i1.p1  ORF type:complete len:193 (-),score=48.31 TRINITY_DN7903_c0_g1_i1:167-745(-)